MEVQARGIGRQRVGCVVLIFLVFGDIDLLRGNSQLLFFFWLLFVAAVCVRCLHGCLLLELKITI